MSHAALNAELRRDPTRTVVLRQRYAADIGRRFQHLKGVIRTTVDTNDALRIGPRRGATILQAPPPAVPARDFDFPTDAEKLDAFLAWLDEAVDRDILAIVRGPGQEIVSRDAWQDVYVRAAYSRGVELATTNLEALGFDVPEEALRQTFYRPIHAESLALLYSRNFRELRGITAAQDQVIARVLAEGFGQGWNPRRMATRINREVNGIGMKRGRLLARTEVIRAHAEGTLNRLQEAGVREVVAEVEFATAGDNNVCAICEALERGGPNGDGVFPIDQARGVIPVHPRCLPGDAHVLTRGSITGVSKRRHDGDLVIIETTHGHFLPCTPNHPILTDGGWLPAHALDVGSCLVRDLLSEWPSLGHGDHVDAPARVEDVAETFLQSAGVASMPVPVSPVDFHGDGLGSEVAVVGTNRLLRHGFDATIPEHLLQPEVVLGNMGLASFSGLGPEAQLGVGVSSPRTCSVCGSDLGLALLGGHLSPLERLGLGLVADVNPFGFQPNPDSRPGDAEPLGNGVLGHPASIESSYEPAGHERITVAGGPKRDSSVLQAGRHRASAQPETAADLCRRESSLVSQDEVVRIHHRLYSGWVYNLETTEGYYFANGLATHNCRCAWLPVVPAVRANARRRGMTVRELVLLTLSQLPRAA